MADTLPNNTSRLFDASSTKFRGINVTSPLTIVTTNDDYLTINSDTYNKQTVDNKISALVNSAPDLLNTLGEISAYLGNPTDTSTTLLTTITNKANTSDTFLKSVINNDVYLKIDNNKRIVGTLTDNKFKFQILDNQGTTFTDAWIDVGTIEFNTLTKKAKFTVKDSLFIDTPDVLTTLNAKLANTDPRITQSAFSWSSTSFGPDGVTLNGAYNYLNTGTDGLNVKVDSSTMSASFFGPNAGTQKGNVLFYKSVEVVGALKVGNVNIITELANKLDTTSLSSYAKTDNASTTFTGTITAPTITASTNLYMGTTNLINTAAAWSTGASGSQHQLKTGPLSLMITTPNNINAIEIAGTEGGLINEGKIFMYKDLYIDDANLTVDGTASITGNLTVLGSSNLTGNLDVSRSDPTGNGNVKISATNTGSSGFTSLYLHTSNQISPIINETAQIFVGQNVGMFLHTRTNHPITFQTYSDQPATTVIPSMKILSTGTRDVEINAPLIVNNNVTINGFLAAKPYVSLRVLTSTATPAVASTGTTAGSIGTPGTVSMTQYGFLTNVSVARGQTGTTNLFTYLFTLPTAHPLGANYIVNGSFYTPSALTASPNAFLTFNVINSTSFNVWVRTATNILMDGNFHVHTVP